MLDDTNISDKNYHVMNELNNMVDRGIECFLLVDNISTKVIDPNFAIINSSRVSCMYDGIVIATSVNTAKSLEKAAINSVKIFYIYEFDWAETVYNFNEIYDLLHSKQLTLVCRSESHAKILKQVFNIDVHHVFQDFEYESFLLLGKSIWNSRENTET